MNSVSLLVTVAQAEAVQASVYQQQSAQSVEMSQQNVDCSDSNTYRQDDSEVCPVNFLVNCFHTAVLDYHEMLDN